MSTRPDPIFLCTSCRGDIPGRVTIHVGLPFCCAGCVAGGPCICSYDPEVPDDREPSASAIDPVAGAGAGIGAADDTRRLAGVV